MWASSGNFEITELELDPPKANEVLVRSCASTSSSRHVIPSRGQPGLRRPTRRQEHSRHSWDQPL